MSYIIIFRNSSRDPQIWRDIKGFIREFYTYEEAKDFGEEVLKADRNTRNPYYLNNQCPTSKKKQ